MLKNIEYRLGDGEQGNSWRERRGYVQSREKGKQRSAWGIWKAGAQLTCDCLEEREQQRRRWDGSKASSWRGGGLVAEGGA